MSDVSTTLRGLVGDHTVSRRHHLLTLSRSMPLLAAAEAAVLFSSQGKLTAGLCTISNIIHTGTRPSRAQRKPLGGGLFR
jgi:hypothetical protein